MHKAVSECLTTVDFAAARDNGGGSGDDRNSLNAKLQSSHHYQRANTQFLQADWLPFVYSLGQSILCPRP